MSLTESDKGSFNQQSVNTELQRFLNPTGRLLICRFTGSKGEFDNKEVVFAISKIIIIKEENCESDCVDQSGYSVVSDLKVCRVR
ncbi:hypothetical protein IEQ34_004078 [Dendrobium chrysotoxum]|uniref:Uncharacterized protein n=1 Tax=Dendrobium chrysotoxum TaxID=161865 RepID=A0AAV7HFE2_DENCH|nr:hypothetical protein IEQ34_004078 [Dendrobium chrysotoxum]